MAKQVRWNTILLDEFSRLAALSELEREVMRTRIEGWTRTKQCAEFHISMSSLDRIISRLKLKYDDVQPYSKILPPRKYSAAETYMDNH